MGRDGPGNLPLPRQVVDWLPEGPLVGACGALLDSHRGSESGVGIGIDSLENLRVAGWPRDSIPMPIATPTPSGKAKEVPAGATYREMTKRNLNRTSNKDNVGAWFKDDGFPSGCYLRIVGLR